MIYIFLKKAYGFWLFLSRWKKVGAGPFECPHELLFVTLIGCGF
jgi:hypothetical protein